MNLISLLNIFLIIFLFSSGIIKGQEIDTMDKNYNFSASFSIKTIDSLPTDKNYSFYIPGVIHATRGYLTDIIFNFLEKPSYNVIVKDFLVNPILEIKIVGFAISKKTILHILKDNYSIKIHSEFVEQGVALFKVPNLSKLEPSSNINAVYPEGNNWIGDGFSINEIKPHLENHLKMEISLLSDDFDETRYKWIIPNDYSFNEYQDYFLQKYQIEIIKEKRLREVLIVEQSFN